MAGNGIANAVANHYNTLEERGREFRQESRIFHMRNFNNWIKSMLINDFADKVKNSKPESYRNHRGQRDISRPEESFTVLDIGCGKGGDLLKWSKAKIDHLVGVDIAQTSVEQAKDRYAEMKARNRHNSNTFSADFYAADCTRVDLETVYDDQNVTFDIVSCQFAFHYCFESIEQADAMLKNVSQRLRPGGFFVGTTPDANEIVTRVKQQTASNSVFKIEFDPPLDDNNPPHLFGAKYNFSLEGAVNNCPEFLVHFSTLVELAEKYGLILICRRRFDSYFNTWKDSANGALLLKRMKCLETLYRDQRRPLAGGDPSGPQYAEARKFLDDNPELHSIDTISKDEWEAITLYLVFAFKKLR